MYHNKLVIFVLIWKVNGYIQVVISLFIKKHLLLNPIVKLVILSSVSTFDSFVLLSPLAHSNFSPIPIFPFSFHELPHSPSSFSVFSCQHPTPMFTQSSISPSSIRSQFIHNDSQALFLGQYLYLSSHSHSHSHDESHSYICSIGLSCHATMTFIVDIQNEIQLIVELPP